MRSLTVSPGSRAGVFSAVGVSSRFGTYVACAEASDYLEQSADPLLPHAWEPRYAWMRMALFSEFVLQVPAFVLGLYALWKGACTILTADDRRLYPVLIAYGAIGTLDGSRSVLYDHPVHCHGHDR